VNFNNFISDVNSDENFCVGVMFNDLSENEKNMILSEMMRYRKNNNNSFFYIFSDNKRFSNHIIHSVFRGYAIPKFNYEEEKVLFSSIKNFIISFEFSKYRLPKEKSYIIPSEESFCFYYSSDDIKKFA
jgi:hypothetical protein